MSGLLSFHIATASSIPGIHEVNDRVTGPSDGSQPAAPVAPPAGLPDAHPAMVKATAVSRAAMTARFV